jgi:glycosyltransferase involved in cell wall biosynthesis
MKKSVSVVIRTLNEERYLKELLAAVQSQSQDRYDIETVIVDSGSTDQTLLIAKAYNCRITTIEKSEFTFGRSLNIGCAFAQGDFLVFISGHCIPVNEQWVNELVTPLEDRCAYSYGRQMGRDSTKFSERQLFKKYFPESSRLPQEGFFCNNANAALRRDVWQCYHFDETLTGCEDMFLGKQLVTDGFDLGYVASAPVYHIHDEQWPQVLNRYEREAVALQRILPEVTLSAWEALGYFVIGVGKDFRAAVSEGVFFREWESILRFRRAQYLGAYRGNRRNRKISAAMKARYFYPRVTSMEIHHDPD